MQFETHAMQVFLLCCLAIHRSVILSQFPSRNRERFDPKTHFTYSICTKMKALRLLLPPFDRIFTIGILRIVSSKSERVASFRCDIHKSLCVPGGALANVETERHRRLEALEITDVILARYARLNTQDSNGGSPHLPSTRPQGGCVQVVGSTVEIHFQPSVWFQYRFEVVKNSNKIQDDN